MISTCGADARDPLGLAGAVAGVSGRASVLEADRALDLDCPGLFLLGLGVNFAILLFCVLEHARVL